MNTPSSFNTFLNELSRELSLYLNETIEARHTTHDEEGIELYTLHSPTTSIGHISHDIGKTIVFLSEQYLLDKKIHRWGMIANIKGQIMGIDIPNRKPFDVLLDKNNTAKSAANYLVSNYREYSPAQVDLTKNCQSRTA